jgi:hypothetical protein
MSVCPEKAISAGRRELGKISWGHDSGIGFLAGTLRIAWGVAGLLQGKLPHFGTEFTCGGGAH